MSYLNKLKEPTPYKWRLQSAKYKKATMVAYIDARQVQDTLDEVVGANNWQSDYKFIDGKLFGGIGIKDQESKEWIWKWDTGVESNIEVEKGQVSDAFKRAAVNWGVGRFLYSLGIITLPTKEYNGKEYPATTEGEILWNKEDISKYCEALIAEGLYDVSRGRPKKVEVVVATELPYIKDSQVEAVIKRIEAGEEGVLDQVLSNFRVSKANLAKLNEVKPTDDSTNVRSVTDGGDDTTAKAGALKWFKGHEEPNKWLLVKTWGKKVAGDKAFKAENAEQLVEALTVDELRKLREALVKG